LDELVCDESKTQLKTYGVHASPNRFVGRFPEDDD
jgi:hypothetical protein